MLKNVICSFLVLIVSAQFSFAQGKYSIKEMTPQVKQALDGRKDRFSQLRSLKASGVVGENNKGYVEVLGGDSQVASIVAAENNDRRVVYQAIASQNGLEGALSTIESAFADVQAEKADAGDKIQTANGAWVSK